eukprot:20128-Heterococcus_DN1.PRE.2
MYAAVLQDEGCSETSDCDSELQYELLYYRVAMRDWQARLMWTFWAFYIAFAMGVAALKQNMSSSRRKSARVERLLAAMTVEEKAGQMALLDLNTFIIKDAASGGATLDEPKLRQWLHQYSFGALFNSPAAIDGVNWTAAEWRAVIRRIQQIAAGEGSSIPLLLGIDTIHGANYVQGAVMGPHQIALAATFNPEIAKSIGSIGARDSRAAALPWLYSPIIGLAHSQLWSRVYETFGEDPLLAATMGTAMINGIQASVYIVVLEFSTVLRLTVRTLQACATAATAIAHACGRSACIHAAFCHIGRAVQAECIQHFVSSLSADSNSDDANNDGEPLKAAACAKHFFGDPVLLGERELLELYLPPWKAAISKANVLTVMEAYSETDGVPMATSKRWLREMLRGELGFTGMLVTDYSEITNVYSWHGAASSVPDAV